jgi:hypothetical protein
MKVEYHQIFNGLWFWHFGMVTSDQNYTRRRDAVRGFERHCAAIRSQK